MLEGSKKILFGYQIIVYLDHKNLVQTATLSKSQRVMRWRLLLEEFAPDIRHISEENNVVADAISRLPTTKSSLDEVPEKELNLQEILIQDQVHDNVAGYPLRLVEVRRLQ